ncbi:MAG: hypothetical protein RI906_2737 [Pseudomonadota bacterium]|jgi:hypothetical protein
MEIFSSRVAIRAGEPLGGSDPDRVSSEASDELEVNGISFSAQDLGEVHITAVDALYAGSLTSRFSRDQGHHLFAASHTHYAPMLDPDKPLIGRYSNTAVDAFEEAIRSSQRKTITPTKCRIYFAQVPCTVYRRFDFPDSLVNRYLTRYCGFYPNIEREIDSSIRIFEFCDDTKSQFVMVYHACHPVAGGLSNKVSTDFVGPLRDAIRARFGVSTVLFLQGCAADIRPNLAKKRVEWLPKSRLNWRFDWRPDAISLQRVAEHYREAVVNARLSVELPMNESELKAAPSSMRLTGERTVNYTVFTIPRIGEFVFLPFEVSHLYQLDSARQTDSRFLVSCSNNTLGYLSHPTQHRAAGYEVDGSLRFMGLQSRLEIGSWN